MDLRNQCAIVTGGTKGIGLAIAEALVAAGANVMVAARNSDEVRETARRLASSAGGTTIGQPCDVQDSAQVKDLISCCVQRLGGLDILINNAGIGIFKTIEEMSLEDWRNTIATNLDSLFFGCHYAIPEMRKRGGGFIINIGSLAGKNAFPGGGAYNASKFGLVGFSEALMQEVRHDDIQVAYVMPGSVDTWFGGKPPVGEESWKIAAKDVAEIVLETLSRHPRCLTSRIEVRPSKPPRPGK
jgi:NAD(P)-dependent dehydrogenase (short-subunit alcohol dehydrogenase family)